MTRGGARAAATALAVAALAPGPVRAEPLADAERGATQVEELLRSVEERAARPEEAAGQRAVQKYSSAETQYLLGDWIHAAVLLGEALDDEDFGKGPQAATATFYLGDALRQADACGAAQPYLEAYLTGGELAHRGEALVAALDCAVRSRRTEKVEPLLAEAARYYRDGLPAELRYLSAKAVLERADLSPAERFAQADAAFAAVTAPYQQQAAYFQGVLRVEQKDLAGAAERFTACGALPARDGRQREVQDLCAIALGRVLAESGDLPAAIAAYGRVPLESPHLDESFYEVAATHARAGQLEPALRAAETLVEIAPDSTLASQAMLLQGQVLLRQGKYEAASERYAKVIEGYAPVRDELDAILTLHEDPVRYFGDLLGRNAKAFGVASVLPAVAVRAAQVRPEVVRAVALVRTLDAEGRDVAESKGVADRVAALLGRGGLDAFPVLRQSYADAQAVENAVAVLQGIAASAAVEAGRGALDPPARDELDEVHAERVVLEARLDALPRSAEAVAVRLDRQRARLDQLDRQAFQMGYLVEASRAAIAGAEAWLASHRTEPDADRAQREGFAAELRKHREVVDEYEEALRSLRHEIALVRDGAGGTEGLDGEARLRGEYLALLARERQLLDGARGRLAQARLDHAGAVSERLAATATRARALEDRLAAEAARRVGALRARVEAERAALDAQVAALAAVQDQAQAAVGQVAYHAFGEVRRGFYGLVLKADVGLNDVAWTRKRDRVERMQKLSLQQAAELKALDERYRPLLKEEE